MIRIGELAKRSGVSSEVLRAWERRYGVIHPGRSEGGFRLYGDDDVARIRRMRTLIDEGMSPAEAARAIRGASAGAPAGDRPLPVELADTLEHALLALDATTAHDTIDALLGAVTVETFLRDVALPVLRRIGERWAGGGTTVAHEHFATNLMRGRLLGLAQGWDRVPGRSALLACAPGELHDIGLIVLGLALSRQGWRIFYLGANMPIDSLSSVALSEHVDLVVVASLDTALFAAVTRDLRALGRRMALALGGAGATADMAKKVYARLLPNDPIAAARELSA